MHCPQDRIDIMICQVYINFLNISLIQVSEYRITSKNKKICPNKQKSEVFEIIHFILGQRGCQI